MGCGEGVPPSSFPREAEAVPGVSLPPAAAADTAGPGSRVLVPVRGGAGSCRGPTQPLGGAGGGGREAAQLQPRLPRARRVPARPCTAAASLPPPPTRCGLGGGGSVWHRISLPTRPRRARGCAGGSEQGPSRPVAARCGLSVPAAAVQQRLGPGGTGSAPRRWWGLCWRLRACGGAEPAAFWARVAQNPGLGAVRVTLPCVEGRKYREVFWSPGGSCRKPRLLLTSAAGDFCEGGSSAENTSGARKVLSSQIRFA